MNTGNNTLMIEKSGSRQRVYEGIADTIMQQINDGTLKPGSRIPTERQLAEQFQSSRTSVREAIHTLSSRGFLESRVGDGTFVREVTLDNLLMPLSSVLAKDRKLIRDVLDVRLILESESACRAAENASNEDIIQMEDAIRQMTEEVNRGNPGLEQDFLFHQQVAHASGNEALAQILVICSDLLSKSTRNSLSKPGNSRKSISDHLKILEAIRNKDPEAASLVMREHLRQGYQMIDA